MRCGWCGSDDMECEYVDNGVGMQQVTPHICHYCGAVEIGPYDKREHDAEEEQRGFYAGEDSREMANPWPMNWDVPRRRRVTALSVRNQEGLHVRYKSVTHIADTLRERRSHPWYFKAKCGEEFDEGEEPDEDTITCLGCLGA